MIMITSLIIVMFCSQFLQRLVALAHQHQEGGRRSSHREDAVISSIATTQQQGGKTVLLCGPVGGGKTMLFQRLTSENDAAPAMTLSSMIAAQGTYNSEQSSPSVVHFNIIDYPGHARLRSALLSNAVIGKSSLVGVIFVLDSTRPNMTECADLLYDVLLQIQHSGKRKSSMRVLICCNKSDMKLAKNEKRIQLQLKTELNRLRSTRGAIESTDGGDLNNNAGAGSIMLGNKSPSIPLDWGVDGGMPCQVSFVSCSCLDANGLKDVRDFIEEASL